MRVIPLDSLRLDDFFEYCRKYGKEHDGSFLYDEDLANFKPGAEHPTYILLDEENRIIGTVSLMIPKHYQELKKGRFRIFHSVNNCLDAYRLMMDAILPHTVGLENIYLFLPKEKEEIGRIFEKLDFEIQRYSWVMKRPAIEATRPEFPETYEIRSLRAGKDEQVWCDFLNVCFENIAGHVDSFAERVAEDMSKENYIDGGMLILWNGDDPVGFVRVTKDEDDIEDYFIEHLGIMPKYQGKNLGRNMLRAGIRFGREHGLNNGWLTVNAENEKAAQLYLSEGFEIEELMVCYNYRVE